MKAQAALEYIIIAGAILVVVIFLFYYASNKAKDDIKLNQAQDAVNAIAKTADNIYSLGPGSRDYVWITIPESVSLSDVDQDNKLILLKLNIFGGSSDIYANTISKVTGSIPYRKGTYLIQVQMLSDGIVYIGDYNDTVAPVMSNIRPVNGSILTYESVQLSLNTNEPAECQYSNTDFEYDDVKGNLPGTEEGAPLEIYNGNYRTVHSLQNNLSLINGTSYDYYFKCIDQFGNNNTEPAHTNFLVFIDLDRTAPIVTLGGIPEDNELFNINTIIFNFTVNDESDIDQCTLQASGTSDEGDDLYNTIILSNVLKTPPAPEQQIITSLDKGNYTWNISCVDTSFWNNLGWSATRNLRVNVSLYDAVQETCQGLCTYEFQFSNGYCARTSAECGTGCGLGSTPDCYALKFDQWCVPTGYKCCCVP